MVRGIRRAVSAVIGTLLAVTLLAGCGDKGLTAASSCKDFLNASAADQDAAVNKLAADLHAPDAVTPLGRPNINYMCAADPSMTLGTAIQRTG